MWRYLLRIFRGRHGARSWDATLTAPIELAKVLMHDAQYEYRKRGLELRQREAAENHRAETAEAERAWQEERERRWEEMTAEERRDGARVLEVRAWRNNR